MGGVDRDDIVFYGQSDYADPAGPFYLGIVLTEDLLPFATDLSFTFGFTSDKLRYISQYKCFMHRLSSMAEAPSFSYGIPHLASFGLFLTDGALPWGCHKHPPKKRPFHSTMFFLNRISKWPMGFRSSRHHVVLSPYDGSFPRS